MKQVASRARGFYTKYGGDIFHCSISWLSAGLYGIISEKIEPWNGLQISSGWWELRGIYKIVGILWIYLSVYGSTVFLLDLDYFFSFLILYTVSKTPWMGDQLVTRLLPTHRTTQTQNKRTQTSMHWVGFVCTIPAFEQGKTVRSLDCVARWSSFYESAERECEFKYLDYEQLYICAHIRTFSMCYFGTLSCRYLVNNKYFCRKCHHYVHLYTLMWHRNTV
jgi:hypothetical protein